MPTVPVYAAGRPHPLREPCQRILVLARQHPRAFFTDAEVLQELLHRYIALHVWPQASAHLRRFSALTRNRVEPLSAADVEGAALLADRRTGLSARDRLHVAVMDRVGASHIASADRGFDLMLHLIRLDPGLISSWEAEVVA